MSVVAVVGLGYVGLPLAVEFGKKMTTIGYDLSVEKVEHYRRFCDPTGEVSTDDLKAATQLTVTTDPADLAKADFIIVAVPTPVDQAHIPDFSPLVGSSTTVGKYMKKGATVIYESTVYPGATEEVCIPILEKLSGMKWLQDFHVGYSPERVNPGDKERTITRIVKVVSGDDAATLDKVADLYGSVITAGVHRASSIKVAEAAKVIENTQRDLNIALMNLTHKADMLGYHPQVILAGRRINDGMGAYVAQETVKNMIANGVQVKGAKVNVLGLTFKENCPDLRNSKVVDVIRELQSFGCDVHVHDPLGEPKEAEHEYGIRLTAWNDLPECDAIIAAVSHHAYLEKSFPELTAKLKKGGAFTDVKAAYDPAAVKAAGFTLWRL